jgi:endonuclease YncB( thermonuclease family)
VGDTRSGAIHCSDYCRGCPAVPVVRVLDGDTLVRAGFGHRRFGVDAPERGESCYEEAAIRLREVAGTSVRVELGPRQGDQYGRILYYVNNTEGESIDEMLVREGLAQPGSGTASTVTCWRRRKKGQGGMGEGVYGKIA